MYGFNQMQIYHIILVNGYIFNKKLLQMIVLLIQMILKNIFHISYHAIIIELHYLEQHLKQCFQMLDILRYYINHKHLDSIL